MLTKILIVLGVIVAAFLVIVALQPSEFRVERSVTIAASPAEVFSHLNDLRKTHAWSPWVKMDPNATFAFEGPSAGVGASSTWSGGQLGEGRQTIVESRPAELVRIRLDFVRPMKSTSTAEFTLKPQGGQTALTWSIHGENKFVSKAFCLFMNQDKMIGGTFERGLADLKALVETHAQK